MVIEKYSGLIYRAHLQIKFGLRRKLRRILHERIFRPGLHCVENHEPTEISLVCLKQLTACKPVMRYAGHTKFWFEIN